MPRTHIFAKHAFENVFQSGHSLKLISNGLVWKHKNCCFPLLNRSDPGGYPTKKDKKMTDQSERGMNLTPKLTSLLLTFSLWDLWYAFLKQGRTACLRSGALTPKDGTVVYGRHHRRHAHAPWRKLDWLFRKSMIHIIILKQRKGKNEANLNKFITIIITIEMITLIIAIKNLVTPKVTMNGKNSNHNHHYFALTLNSWN